MNRTRRISHPYEAQELLTRKGHPLTEKQIEHLWTYFRDDKFGHDMSMRAIERTWAKELGISLSPGFAYGISGANHAKVRHFSQLLPNVVSYRGVEEDPEIFELLRWMADLRSHGGKPRYNPYKKSLVLPQSPGSYARARITRSDFYKILPNLKYTHGKLVFINCDQTCILDKEEIHKLFRSIKMARYKLGGRFVISLTYKWNSRGNDSVDISRWQPVLDSKIHRQLNYNVLRSGVETYGGQYCMGTYHALCEKQSFKEMQQNLLRR